MNISYTKGEKSIIHTLLQLSHGKIGKQLSFQISFYMSEILKSESQVQVVMTVPANYSLP